MMIRNFDDVLTLWTGPKELAALLNVPYPTAAAMWRRRRIGSAYWAQIIKAANARGVRLTADMLVKFASKRGIAQPSRRRATKAKSGDSSSLRV